LFFRDAPERRHKAALRPSACLLACVLADALLAVSLASHAPSKAGVRG